MSHTDEDAQRKYAIISIHCLLRNEHLLPAYVIHSFMPF